MPKIIENLENLDNSQAVKIGTGWNIDYDLWDILSFSGAQEFVVDGSDNQAGSAYVQNETIFNNNINESQHLYFFTITGTNRVVCGIVANTNNNYQTLNIKVNNGQCNASIPVDLNIMFEDAGQEISGKLNISHYSDENLAFPLYLIPNLKLVNRNEAEAKLGLIVDNGCLKAVLTQLFNDPDSYDSSNLDLTLFPEITKIDRNAFKYFPNSFAEVTINHNIKDISRWTFEGGVDIVNVTELDDDPSWSGDWTAYLSDRVNYGYGLDDTERARIKAEIEAKKTENLRYKVINNEITILGIKINPSKTLSDSNDIIEIPEEIEGHPVTVISSYAFYKLKNVSKFILPPTIKRIEQGAFAGCRNYVKVVAPKNCLVGKYNDAIDWERI